MKRYFVSIAEKDEIARARGSSYDVGATFWAGHIDAIDPTEAKQIAVKQFMTPLNWKCLPEADRGYGEAMEALASVKRNVYINGDCVVTARLSKAKH